MLVAMVYIGSEYTPGEVLPDNLDEELVKRLLEVGAVKKTAPDPLCAAPAPEVVLADECAEGTGEEAEVEENVSAAEDDEPEPPEVDAASALVQDEAKPAKSRKAAKNK